jgi:hypothetical protein
MLLNVGAVFYIELYIGSLQASIHVWFMSGTIFNIWSAQNSKTLHNTFYMNIIKIAAN